MAEIRDIWTKKFQLIKTNHTQQFQNFVLRALWVVRLLYPSVKIFGSVKAFFPNLQRPESSSALKMKKWVRCQTVCSKSITGFFRFNRKWHHVFYTKLTQYNFKAPGKDVSFCVCNNLGLEFRWPERKKKTRFQSRNEDVEKFNYLKMWLKKFPIAMKI